MFTDCVYFSCRSRLSLLLPLLSSPASTHQGKTCSNDLFCGLSSCPGAPTRVGSVDLCPCVFLILVSVCRHAAQEYIRRQLEEEQRQLEILQQQLLQEQALLLVMVLLMPHPPSPSVLCAPPPHPHCMHRCGSSTETDCRRSTW